MAQALGTRLGPYEILAPLGAGGMGEVYRARDTRLDRDVAVKVLPQHLASSQEDRARFQREAKTISALNHPHICVLHDVGCEGETDFLVMELVEGETLAHRLGRGPLLHADVLKLGIQIAGALEAAHRGGILHRDLKPANVLVTLDGAAKLLDFGLAKLMTTDADVTRTMDGAVAGTAAYMSPEQVEGKPLDARSDIFSFGAVLYEMLAGRRAFAGTTTVQVLNAVLREDPAPAQAPAALDRIVRRCLRKRSGDRFQTMANVRVALEDAARDPASAHGADAQPSIAVLPFADLSPGGDHEWFSDGVAEEITNELTRVPGLRVIARTSAFAFKGKQDDIRRIAEALGVAHVLEGSVRKTGNRIRVTAQLIAAADGSHVWLERYDRELADVFAIQDEIAQKIAAALSTKLAMFVKERPVDLEVYELYLRGRHIMMRGGLEDVRKAIEYFQSGLAKAPRNALLYSGLADAYIHKMSDVHESPVEATAKARAAAMKALELDESLAEAHTSLASIKLFYDWDWTGGEIELRRALELNPSYSLAYRIYGAYLTMIGRHPEALPYFEKAHRLDPLYPGEGYSYFMAHKYDEAIEQYRKGFEIEPGISVLSWPLQKREIARRPFPKQKRRRN